MICMFFWSVYEDLPKNGGAGGAEDNSLHFDSSFHISLSKLSEEKAIQILSLHRWSHFGGKKNQNDFTKSCDPEVPSAPK